MTTCEAVHAVVADLRAVEVIDDQAVSGGFLIMMYEWRLIAGQMVEN